MVQDELKGKPTDQDEGDALQVAEAAAGSRVALGRLYHRHKDAVYRLAYRITGSSQDAEDVLQDVFVGLERALGRYDEKGRFRSWLLKVTARTAQLRLRHRGETSLDEVHRGHGGQEFDSSPRSPDAVIDRIVVQHALARMPEHHRLVFLLKEVEGYRHREIAELVGISVVASRVQLHRAWRFLESQVRAR